jgi:hypothetical protein
MRHQEEDGKGMMLKQNTLRKKEEGGTGRAAKGTTIAVSGLSLATHIEEQKPNLR